MHDEDAEAEKMSTNPVDNKVFRMMQMMGYKTGQGLGKHQQGITLPVKLEQNFGKRGLGLQIQNLQFSTEQWDFSLEENVVNETVDWLSNNQDLHISEFDMQRWVIEGKPITTIEEEYNFCDREVLKNVMEAKDIFEELDLKELCQARARANPFESIRSMFFLNRAALKMANIDAATGFIFTNIDRNPHHKTVSEPYYFADVCAGPGGFTEYILWRKKWSFKGFGLTLRDENDFKIRDSVCTSPVTFLPLYGATGDGNVCCPANIDDFKEKIMHETANQGVHFMMSDGGFSVEGKENLQEILSKHIYLCQCLVALEILRKHGHFVTKVFDVFTAFSVGLLFLMYHCFEKVCIIKPNSSRPANSERYFICNNFKGASATCSIKKYLSILAQRLWEIRDNNEIDINEIVSLEILKNDEKFYNYIYNSNNNIAKKQTISLKKLASFCRNPLLIDTRQYELRSKCLHFWQIPDKPKFPVSKFSVEDILSATIDKKELLLMQPRECQSLENLHKNLSTLNDWYYTLIQCKRDGNSSNFYAGVGVYKTYRLVCNKWMRIKNLQLPRGTLLYGELVKETTITDTKDQKCKYSLHVIDALRLGDVNLGDLKFNERANLIQVFCKSINHEFRKNAIRVRYKIINPLGDLIENDQIKIRGDSYTFLLPLLGYKTVEESYEVNSILLLKTDQYQSFHSTYVLRIQYFIDKVREDEGKLSPLQTLRDFIVQKSRKDL